MPTIMIAAALTGHVARAIAAHRPTRLSLCVPVAAAVLGVYLTSPTIFHDSYQATVEFDGVKPIAADREKNLGGTDRSVRAILDLVSHDDDALLAWTFDPSLYTRFHRVSATRFQWKWLLQGAIYLGRTSPDYVLPDTWRWFREDLAQSKPAAFVETEPYDAGTPFADVVERDFTVVYPGPTDQVWLRRDVARDLLTAPATAAAWSAPGPVVDSSGWSVSGDAATNTRTAVPANLDLLPLSAVPCTRIDGVLAATDGSALPDVVLHFAKAGDAREETQHLALEGTMAGAGSAGLGPMGFESLPSGVASGPVPFSVVVGDRSAVLVVAGQVRGAVRLHEGVVSLGVESRSAALQVSGLRTSAAPTGGGCPSGSRGAR
jgi:hypothetical protein